MPDERDLTGEARGCAMALSFTPSLQSKARISIDLDPRRVARQITLGPGSCTESCRDDPRSITRLPACDNATGFRKPGERLSAMRIRCRDIAVEFDSKP